MRPAAILLLLLVVGGCSLDRRGVGVEDPSFDAGRVDASELDGDVPDAPLDADLPDAPDVGVDAGPCVPATETCDLTDEDCDERVDEDACGCRSFEHGGHVYQDCPHVTGFAAWSGACRKIGPGYDLVVIETSSEDDAIDAATSELSWIGLNDFDANGEHRWVDRTPPGHVGAWLGTEGTRDWESCFGIHGSGEWDDYPCSGTLRVICEGDPGDRCVPSADGDASCDAVDDDCDGAVDEDCDLDAGCTSFTFWDRVYLECTEASTFDGARAACSDAGYALATIDNPTEDDGIDDLVDELWIGLRQTGSPSTPDAGWAWVDGSGSTFRSWGAIQPDDGNGSENGMEDCARMRVSDDWGDRGCESALPFLCRRAFAR